MSLAMLISAIYPYGCSFATFLPSHDLVKEKFDTLDDLLLLLRA